MSEPPTTPEQADTVFPLSRLNNPESLDLEALLSLIDSSKHTCLILKQTPILINHHTVHNPTLQILSQPPIPPTNPEDAPPTPTFLLLTLFFHLLTLVYTDRERLKATQPAINLANKDLDAMNIYLQANPNIQLKYPEYRTFLELITHIYTSKMTFMSIFCREVEKIGVIIEGMSNVLRSVRNNEGETGETDIRRCEVAYGVVNAQWSKFSGMVKRVVEARRRMERVEGLRGRTWLVWVHARRAGKLVLGGQFRELIEEVRLLATAAVAREEGD